MGLFDRLRGNRSEEVKVAGNAAEANPKKKDDTFYLDADAAKSLGDVNFMRRSNTIRRTFPGSADSPGGKEMVAEVASMEAKLEKMSPGLGGASTETNDDVSLTGGIPKPVKKTFAQQMSSGELAQRLKGVAVSGVNVPGAPASPCKQTETASPSQASSDLQSAKPGVIDPFKAMAKDLNG